MSGLSWDDYFLNIASVVAMKSKDPSTKVGCVIVDDLHRVVSIGFNGFPRGIADDERLYDRSQKYEMVLHAEMNSILFAGRDINGCTAYVWPLPSCSRCAAAMIQAGISRVVSPPAPDRWKVNCDLAAAMFREAGIEVVEVVDV